MIGRRPVAALLAATALAGLAMPAQAARRQVNGRAATPPRPTLRYELDEAKKQIADQQTLIQQQEERLRALEVRLEAAVNPASPLAASSAIAPPSPAAVVAAAQGSASTSPGDPAGVQQPPLSPVGEAPADIDRPPEVAVLGQQGSVVTRAGQLTAEVQFDYARADRNRALFRGIEVVEAVLVGVFDINESRQDVLTASGSLRYGITDRLEIGARLPFVHRSDTSILTPIQGTTTDDDAASIDSSAKGSGIGDLELSARYQLVSARAGWPFLIGNLQLVVPTGTDPFEVKRDALGEAREAATGAGFWGVSPSLTAILPTDPAVLFGTVGYTFNFGRHVSTRIPPVLIDFVDPGDAISFSGGIGLALNQRTSLNIGYAHSWAFGTTTRTRLIDPTPTWPGTMKATSRDLQLGRLLFGMTYRVSNRASLNWSVEVGATDDATDLRTVLRIPLVLLSGRGR